MNLLKSKAAMIALFVIAAAAALVALSRIGLLGGDANPPNWVNQEMVERIDVKTLEVISLPLGKWQELGNRDGLFQNPKTGAYTMAGAMTCPHCKATIPNIMSAPALSTASASPERTALCPKCGKNPFAE